MIKYLSVLLIVATTANGALTLNERNELIDESFELSGHIHDVQEHKRAELARYLNGSHESFRSPGYQSKDQLNQSRNALLGKETTDYTSTEAVNMVFKHLRILHNTRENDRHQIAQVLPGTDKKGFRTDTYLDTVELEALRAALVEKFEDKLNFNDFSDEELRQLIDAASL